MSQSFDKTDATPRIWRRSTRYGAVSAALVLLLSACGDDGGSDTDETADAQEEAPETGQESPGAGDETLADAEGTDDDEHLDEAQEEPEAEASEDEFLEEVYDPDSWNRVGGPFFFHSDDLEGAQGQRVVDTVSGTDFEVPLPSLLSDLDLDADEIQGGPQWTYSYQGDEPVVVIALTVRHAASGLEGEGTTHEVLVVDPESPETAAEQHSFEEDELGEALPELLRHPGGGDGTIALEFTNEDGDSETSMTYGIDIADGSVAWEYEGGIRNTWENQVRVGPSELEDGVCPAHAVINVSTGDVEWELDAEEAANYVCPEGTLSYVYSEQFTVLAAAEEADGSLEAGDLHAFNHETGESAQIPAGDPTDITGVAGDLVQPNLAVVQDSETTEVRIVDLTDGESIYTVDAETVEEVDFSPTGIYDGQLYGTTTDEQIVIDPEVGDVIGYWRSFPFSYRELNDITWFEDGTVARDWEYDPDDDHGDGSIVEDNSGW